ncbi:MAG TPA: SDR family oxidoreductase [Candidatus Acidoferrales bacterium]|nr:SDR family oxidoreductase [Candidatus Acidoferrales bacterium]
MEKFVVVTGGAGFIGSHVARRLVRDGARVRVVDDLSTGKKERLQDLLPAIEFERADLADPAVCDRAVRDAECVLHQAAIPSVQRSVEDPVATNRANVTATLNLLESARRHGVRRFVFAGSSSVYGDAEVSPKREDLPPNPRSPYALQKLVGERYAELYYRLFGLETVTLRYFNVFGPSQDPNSEYSAVIPKFIARLLAGKPLTVYGDGEQSRDFTYVENAVTANLLALKTPAASGQVFNVGCGRSMTLNRLIKVLEGVIGVKARVEYVSPRPGDVRHSLADLTKAGRELGYKPLIGVEEGLRKTVEAMKSQSR